MTDPETIAQLRAAIAKAQDESSSRGLTLVTLCDMVLGENTNDASDDALIRGVRELLNESSQAKADNARLAAALHAWKASADLIAPHGDQCSCDYCEQWRKQQELSNDTDTTALRDLLAVDEKPLMDYLQWLDRQTPDSTA